MTKSGPRRYQLANYRDHVRPPKEGWSTGHAIRGKLRGARGVMPPDQRALAQAARAASRGFVYARVTGSSRMFAVPLSSPV